MRDYIALSRSKRVVKQRMNVRLYCVIAGFSRGKQRMNVRLYCVIAE
jgi:hypothetical protein